MKLVSFNASCPFEVGDKVRTKSGDVHEITDICCAHYIKSGTVEFLYALDGSNVFQYLEVREGEEH